MSYELARDYIAGRWSAQWVSGSPAAARTPTQYRNVRFDPPAASQWARLTIIDGDASQISTGDPGNNTHRHSGVIAVQIFDVYGSGTKSLRRLGDQAAAIFRNQRFGNVFCRVPVVTENEAEAGWCSVTVTVPFYFDDLQ